MRDISADDGDEDERAMIALLTMQWYTEMTFLSEICNLLHWLGYT